MIMIIILIKKKKIFQKEKKNHKDYNYGLASTNETFSGTWGNLKLENIHSFC